MLHRINHLSCQQGPLSTSRSERGTSQNDFCDGVCVNVAGAHPLEFSHTILILICRVNVCHCLLSSVRGVGEGGVGTVTGEERHRFWPHG